MRDATILAQPGASELPQVRRGSRTRLVRRVILFQVKLFADGLRDFVMSPLSIVAGVLGILFSRDPEGSYDRLMRFGRETDRWINLFDAYGEEEGGRAPTLDTVADEIETAIRRDYADGGMSARSAEAMLGLARQLRRRR
ncbi:hypothetical protein [Chelativorans xinjiangense]|uniref:hypothetical protein n=1 Tax=Chelativorans xinjiangense TaxID=2681485 RepID=UPI001359ACE8|nr:hypothetical protein [Chelativorans xinjiangense]